MKNINYHYLRSILSLFEINFSPDLLNLCCLYRLLFADRTPKRLEFTLEVAEGTLNRSAEVLQTITPISKKVEKWANSMRNNEYSTEAYKEAVLSAGEAGTVSSELLAQLMMGMNGFLYRTTIFFIFNIICSGKPQCAGS